MDCVVGQIGIDATLQRIRGHIETIGWSVMGVGGSASAPAFHYTCGLTTLEHPEIIISGNFNPHQMTGLLNCIGEDVKLNGRKFKHGWHTEVLQTFIVPMFDVRQDVLDSHFGMCNRMYGNGNFKALQLFLPDKNGIFPGNKNYRWSKQVNFTSDIAVSHQSVAI